MSFLTTSKNVVLVLLVDNVHVVVNDAGMRVGLVCFVNSNAKQTLKTTLSNFTKLYPSVCFELHRALSYLDLAAGDGDGCARGEAGNDWLGDEVDEEAQPEVVTDEHDVVGGEDDGDDRDVDENDGDGDKDEVEPEVPADEDNDPREERK